jgi:hypothetical protein
MIKFNLKNISIAMLSLVLILAIGYSTIRFGLSKDNISYPTKDHSHFRIKYIFNGQEENFGGPRYQTDYTKDVCGGTLTEAPLHFHDNKTDYQHEHWGKMTGGQMLKFYGLNYIGGLDNYMGFKIDQLPKITPVPIHSNSLPKPRISDKFWIYSGVEKIDNSGIWETKIRTFDEFINQDFETFFGKESQVRKDIEKYGVSYMDFFSNISVQAHSGVEHKTLDEEQKHILELGEKAQTEKLNNQVITSSSSADQQSSSKSKIDPITGEELKSINNFLGDVIVFVQPEAPNADQVQARFKSMVKLDKSVCGG